MSENGLSTTEDTEDTEESSTVRGSGWVIAAPPSRYRGRVLLSDSCGMIPTVVVDMLIVDPDHTVLKWLKDAAKSRERSLKAEIYAISAQWIANLTGRQHPDSTVLIRQDRDSRR